MYAQIDGGHMCFSPAVDHHWLVAGPTLDLVHLLLYGDDCLEVLTVARALPVGDVELEYFMRFPASLLQN